MSQTMRLRVRGLRIRMRLVAVCVTLSIGVAVDVGHPRRPKPAACPGARFVVTPGAPPLIAGAASPALDVVEVGAQGAARTVALASGCDPVRAQVKTTKRGTRLTARWPRCGEVQSVRLVALIQPGCDRMAGTLKAKRARRQTFEAIRSECGDRLLDPGRGESCEPEVLPCPDGSICTECACQPTPPATSTTSTTTTSSTTATGVTTTTSSIATSSTAPGGTTSTTVAGGTTSTTTSTQGTTSTTTTTLPGQLPPDPSAVAPPPSDTVLDFAGSIEFLWSGSGIQTGVVPGAVEPRRVSVVRGRVTDPAGQPIGGVHVTVLSHPELGQTLTRTDGWFDMAVNGGGMLVIRYRKPGYPEVQRRVAPGWNTWDALPTVVLTPLDVPAAVVLDGRPDLQVARGSIRTDSDGSRRATVLFKGGTQASMVLPSGVTQPLVSLTVRASEYTVGAQGPAAMPGELPATTNYTYAVELSVDEAMAADATEVRFDRDVVVYVDNFLGFPVGAFVPVGVYDRQAGQWEGEPDARIVGILPGAGGVADVDLDGDAVVESPAALAAVGIDEAERRTLATLYAAGGSVWRTSVRHFSPYDLNMANGLPPDWCPDEALLLNQCPPDFRKIGRSFKNLGKQHPCQEKGSTILCEDQSVVEDVAVAGTPFRLRWASNRARWASIDQELAIPLTHDAPSPYLKRVELHASIGGQQVRETFDAASNLTYALQWDGNDAWGRPMFGETELRGTITWVLDATWLIPGQQCPWGTCWGVEPPHGVELQSPTESNREARVSRAFSVPVRARRPSSAALGGFALDVHHDVDPGAGEIAFGDGTFVAPTVGSIRTVAGSLVPTAGVPPDGSPATSAMIVYDEIDTAPDGGFYLTQFGTTTFHVDAGGTWNRVGCQPGDPVACRDFPVPSQGDEIPLAELRVAGINFTAVDRDGRLLLSTGSRLWRVDADGIVRRIGGMLGCSSSVYPANGVLARDACILFGEMAPAPDGSLYFASLVSGKGYRVYQLTPSGHLVHVAGTGAKNATGFSGDGGPATAATIVGESPVGLAHDPASGAIYVVQQATSDRKAIALRVGADGIISRVAGNEACDPTVSPIGAPPLDACLATLTSLAVGPDGALYGYLRNTLYPEASLSARVVRLGETVTNVAGGGDVVIDGAAAGDLQLRTAAQPIRGMAFTGKGSLLVADPLSGSRGRIVEIVNDLPRQPGGGLLVPNGDGTLLHEFDADARHVATRDRLTGNLRWGFGYDDEGRLATVTDDGGRITTVERTAGGDPTAIVAPGGQRTTLETQDGLLTRITNPADESIELTYAGTADGLPADSGLLKTFRQPSGAVTRFAWDAAGRLTTHESAIGGVTRFTRTAGGNFVEVSRETPTGQVWRYRIEELPDDTVVRTTTAPTGAESVERREPTGVVRQVAADGSTLEIRSLPDPRFGMLLPYVESGVVTKNATSVTVTQTRTLTPGAGPLGIGRVTEAVRVNGGLPWTTVYDSEARQVRRTTPTGREQVESYDELGRFTSLSVGAGAAPLVLGWNGDGLLGSLARGIEQFMYGYDSKLRVSSIALRDGRVLEFGFDLADRPISAVLASGEPVALGWTPDGFAASFAVAGGGTHGLEWNGVGARTGYTPPGATAGYAHQYRPDGSLAKNVLPSGREVAATRDAAARPTGFVHPDATMSIAYVGDTELPATLTRTPAGAGTAHTMSFAYTRDLVTRLDTSGAATSHYAYTRDGQFRVSSVQVQDDFGFTFAMYPVAYDADGLRTTVGPMTWTRQGPNGLVSRIAAGPAELLYAYTPELRLASRTLRVGGVDRFVHAVAWGAAGTPASATATIGAGTPTTWTYAYDGHGRIASVVRDGTETEAYDYDARGNRTSVAYDGGAAVVAGYDAQDRQLTRGVVGYTVDDDGFLVARGGDTFTYTAVGELVAATVGGATVTYDHDALRRRVRRTQGGAVVEYHYGDLDDPGRVTASRDASGQLWTYLYDELGYLAVIQRDGTSWYVGTDHLGSPRLVADAAGATVRRADYDAYGRETVVVNALPTLHLPIGFAGGIRDAATGLVRFGLRDYDPLTGRWTARDPAFLGGKQFNLYAYAGSNPLGYRDPSGTVSFGGSLFAGLGGGFKINITAEGFSACGELGAGLGESIDVAPLSGLDETFNGFEVAATAKVGPLASLGAEGTYGQYGNPYDGPNCFKGGSAFKGAVGPVEADVGKALGGDLGDTKGNALAVKEFGDFVRGGLRDGVKFGAEGKAVWKSCGKYLW